jgi:hypothetical protein
MKPKAMITPVRGIAARLSSREEIEMRLKEFARKGKTPSCAVRDKAKRSLIVRGRRGKNFLTAGKKRMMERVAANVSSNPMSKR